MIIFMKPECIVKIAFGGANMDVFAAASGAFELEAY